MKERPALVTPCAGKGKPRQRGRASGYSAAAEAFTTLSEFGEVARRQRAAGKGGEVLGVFGKEHAQDARLGQPGTVAELGVDDRVGAQLGTVEQAAHLEQGAGHVIVVGHQNDGAIGVARHPFGAFLGIADGVERGAVDVDAAIEQAALAAGHGAKRVAARPRVDAADQQPLALAGLQQVECGIDARLAAGQHDDGVGRARIDRGRQAAHMVGEQAEADRPSGYERQNGECGVAQNGQREHRPGWEQRSLRWRRQDQLRLLQSLHIVKILRFVSERTGALRHSAPQMITNVRNA